MTPQLGEAEQAKISGALGILGVENKAFDVALAAVARREAAVAAGADPETGEVMQYEPPQEAA